jgi:hypothetical protein
LHDERDGGGNVTLEQGAGLLATDTTIDGNLVGKDAGQISLDFVTVVGSVKMSGDPSNLAAAALSRSASAASTGASTSPGRRTSTSRTVRASARASRSATAAAS